MPDHGSHDAFGTYVSPLASRYASDEMQSVWSPRRKHETWRRIWLALAEAQHELGLKVTAAQLDALRAHLTLDAEDFSRAEAHEARLRHDVMAHVHAYADVAPEAGPIIHLGATSQDINCNTEIPQIRDALLITRQRTAALIDALATFAERHRDQPCLGLTHYQPAQPTTVGKRAAAWAYDIWLCLSRLEFTCDELRLRGMKGATGTQASFLRLFDNDAEKVAELERRVAGKLGWAPDMLLLVTGQTYPRVVDAFVLSDLAALASVIHKMCNDIRLLSNRKELDEPFAASQIGSSAMPYKRNP
ncbi:MAG: adenylosuccinate lyase, partial [Phycisphaerales bacterium]|nr:adenylosuccinate lyase [Phycisphaerales bacterium]